MSYNPTTPTIISGDTINAPCNDAIYTALANKQPTGNYITALTGQVTATGPGSVAATIATNTVSNSNLAQIATQTFKGRTNAGTGNVEDLSATQATAILNAMVGDSGSGGTKGLVPAPAAGDAAAGKYLKANGTWSAVSGLPAYSQDKVLYSTASGSEWRIVGTGSSDSSYPTNTIILGQAKPGSLTGANNTIVSATPNSVTVGQDNVFIGSVGSNVTTGGANVYIGSLSTGNNPPSGAIQNVVIGSRTRTGGSNLVLIGDVASGYQNGVAIGQSALCGSTGAYNNQYNVAVGNYASTYEGSNAVAVGQSAEARKDNSTVIGAGAKSYGTDSVVVGYNSGKNTLVGANNVVVGSSSLNSASLTSAANCVVVGQGSATAVTTATGAVILGQSAATALTTGTDSIAIGRASVVTATGSGAVAIGTSATANNAQAPIAIGNLASSTGAQSIAIGYNSTSTGSGSVAIGNQASAQANDSTAVGNIAKAGIESVSVGTYAGYYNQGTYSVAIGLRSNAGNTLGTTVGYRAGGTSFSGTYSNGTHLGAYAGNALTTGSSNVYLGYYAGGRSTIQSNELFVDNQDRTTYGTQQTDSLIYGQFNATASSQVLTVNAALKTRFGVSVTDAGYGLSVKTGSNAKAGVTGAFPGGNPNTITVSTTAVTANSSIFVTIASIPGTISGAPYVSAITAGTSFVITVPDNGFNGTVAWMIVERI